MPTLAEILDQFPAEDSRRMEQSLRLMALLAVGSEAYRQEVESWSKDDKSPVTVADLLHQTLIQQMLAESFPQDGLVAEEPLSLQQEVMENATAAASKHYRTELKPEIPGIPERGEDITWMLDPIDGTKGYLAGRYYAIALGYFHGDEGYFGAMAVPHAPLHKGKKLNIDNALAFAVKGKGAWIGSLDQGNELVFEPLVTQQDGFSKPYQFAVSLEHGGDIESRFPEGTVEAVKLDSQAKYLAVAANDLDAYMRKTRGDGGSDVTWDHMPGALIASEAGARVCQFNGEPARFEPKDVVKFAGGVACHRGESDSEVGEMIASLAKG